MILWLWDGAKPRTSTAAHAATRNTRIVNFAMVEGDSDTGGRFEMII